MATAVWLGMNVSGSPFLLLMSIAATAFLVLSTLGAKIEQVLLLALVGLILGYMVQGRGFAYLGVPPLYVGEAVLFLGIATLLFAKIKWHVSYLELGLIAFMIIGLIRTIPYFGEYGLFAIRDAALWYYAVFALIVSWMLTESRLRFLLRHFAALLPLLIVWYMAMSTALRVVDDYLPHYPGSPLPILSVMKPGDRAVFLVWMAALLLSGLYRQQHVRVRIPNWFFWPSWLLCALVVAVENRGGMLAISLSLLLVIVLRPTLEWLKIAFIGLSVLALLLVWNPTIDIGGERKLSVSQLTINVTSIVTDDTPESGSVQGTKSWRTEFWNTIYRDVVEGQYFWTGRGFGINLGLDYGVTVHEDIRSPHNSFFTVLVRMGVPGALLWLSLQVIFFIRMVQVYRLANKRKDQFWISTNLWLLAIWFAALINSMFDVYLEGPQGAIPFWCVFGIGIASMRFQSSASHAEQSNMSPRWEESRAYPARP